MSKNKNIAFLNDGDKFKIEITSPEVDKLLRATLPSELELNRAWVYDGSDDPIGETNFVVSEDFVRKVFDEKYAEEYDSDFDDFLDVYEPEEEGEYIYQKAIELGQLKEDIGVVFYNAEYGEEHVLIITRTGFTSEHEEIRGTLFKLRKKIRKMYEDLMSPSDDDDDIVINGHWKDEWSDDIIKKDEITYTFQNGMECITEYAFIIRH